MSGGYKTHSRELTPLMPGRVRYQIGSYPATQEEMRVTPELQTVRSWRTGATGPSEREVLEADTRIFRNGFTTNDPRYDRGHEFFTTKTRWWLSHRDSYVTTTDSSSRQVWARGPLIPSFHAAKFGVQYTAKGWNPYPGVPSTSDHVALGQRAILNCIPTNPTVSSAQFVGELFQALPSAIGTTLLRGELNHFRNLGGEYLNIQFGWVPFLADLVAMVQSLRNASRAITQLQRDSGRRVRRQFRFAPTVSVSETKSDAGATAPFTGHQLGWYLRPGGGAVNEITRLVRTDREVWFSGSFTYYVPRNDSLLSKLARYEQMANKLLGTRITPSVLWELSPWSWLLDWKVSIGDAIGVASALQNDNLVMEYGYLMVHTKEEHFYSTAPGVVTRTGTSMPSATASFSRETKQRIRATPYGFGVNSSTFSARQNAILLALGLSMSPSIRN